MDWKIKALIQNILAAMPKPIGNRIHYRLQYSKGGLRPDSMYDTAKAFFFMDAIQERFDNVEDLTVFELGSGRSLHIPLCLWLCGINRQITADLNRYYNPEITTEYISFWEDNLDELISTAGKYGATKLFQDRLATLFSHKHDPDEIMSLANIEYRAPFDARSTNLQSGSVDFYYSTNVLEHVQPDSIVSILKEQSRILKPDGLAVHRVNPGDHFSYFDPAITSIHFLKFSKNSWKFWGENRFAYHNRLRLSDYFDLFRSAGCSNVTVLEQVVDEKAKTAIESGFPIHPDFKNKSVDDLATLGFIVAMKNS
jgi:SAM-dependent methyltransferase